MTGDLLRPGSFPWLVAHDLQLSWRRFADMLGGVSHTRGLLIAILGGVALHALAWPAVPMLDVYMQGSSTLPEHRLAIAGLLICVASWMLAQGLFAATRTLFDRGDLDLLYGSPLPPGRILAAKAAAIALSSLGSVALLALPIANIGIVRFGTHWLAVYPALAGTALIATALALGLTIVLFRVCGPRRARTVAHLTGALVGGAFVLGAQVVALLPDGIRQGLTRALAPPVASEATPATRLLWLPVDAMLGDPMAAAILMVAGIGAFLLATGGLGESFARLGLVAVGSPHGEAPRAETVRFGSSANPGHALRSKEWRLLLRDPSLFAQLGLQIVYTIPLAVVLVRSGTRPLALALTPAIVVIAAQVAASLAWLAVSAEDAPELIASAPVAPGAADLAKLSAVAIPVAVVAGLPISGLALVSLPASLLAFLFAAGASASTILLNLWHPMPASRRGMLRRHSQSKLIGLFEHLLAILWAIAAVLALVGSGLWIAPVVVAFAVLAATRRMNRRPTRSLTRRTEVLASTSQR